MVLFCYSCFDSWWIHVIYLCKYSFLCFNAYLSRLLYWHCQWSNPGGYALKRLLCIKTFIDWLPSTKYKLEPCAYFLGHPVTSEALASQYMLLTCLKCLYDPMHFLNNVLQMHFCQCIPTFLVTYWKCLPDSVHFEMCLMQVPFPVTPLCLKLIWRVPLHLCILAVFFPQ